MENVPPPQGVKILPALLRDGRILQGIAQIVFVLVVVIVFNDLALRINSALDATNQSPNFEFLQNRAGFNIADSGSYSSNDRYVDAFRVGFINTLRVVSVGLVATTILGMLVGVLLLNNNFLVRSISRVYVEVLRNTPVLLQIFTWYFVVLFALPPQQESIELPQEGIRSLPLLQYALSLVVLVGIWRLSGSLRRKSWRILAREGGVAIIILVNLLGIELVSSGTPVELLPAIYISIKGVALFELLPSALFGVWMVFVVIGILVAAALWRYLHFITDSTGRPTPRTSAIVISVAGFTLLGWLIVGMLPTPSVIQVYNEDHDAIVDMEYDDAFESGLLTIDQELEYTRQPLLYRPPTLDRRGRNVETGIEISPAYLAVFLGLVIYTSAFIAEIVRAGIQAVPKGQLEASRALGISQGDMLRRIVLPQALRVIIPPLGNQYLNLSKNSSLAIAVSYTDIFQVTNTIINQSGQSVTGILMVLLAYLVISLAISLVMNLVNQRFEIVSR
ncbi:MAG: ABC transporter permease subunit [Chloroflexi bacterium]|nr:ABC transporter permease subunit [Chloroflexota bacterium]MYA93470.1 ABC transporter permease subunit [Chloroflexota bacterium]MYC56708.1 ABC transporter permease subunit [Chloroflexota bacterium]MYD40079.1 ABC transporter permease subunit [Chloroflexota bacterium]MYE77715.1 ABC transporter permease subunit [Chloroflexota bacterium]